MSARNESRTFGTVKNDITDLMPHWVVVSGVSFFVNTATYCAKNHRYSIVRPTGCCVNGPP